MSKVLCQKCGIRKAANGNEKYYSHGLCRVCRREELQALNTSKLVKKKKPKPKPVRYYNCRFYLKCISRVAYISGRAQLYCEGCRQYWPEVERYPDEFELAGCMALIYEVFNPGTVLHSMHGGRPVLIEDLEEENKYKSE